MQVYELFRKLDKNGNGSICMKEFRQGLKELGYQLTDSEVAHLMARMDLVSASDFKIK